MRNLSEAELKEISENGLMGMLSFVHKITLEIEAYPDSNHILDFDDSDEIWQELKEKLDQNIEDYIRVCPMMSYESFKIMEDFVEIVDDKTLHIKLRQALERRKPFHNFKLLIDNFRYRDDWFKFEMEEAKKYVRKQLLLT